MTVETEVRDLGAFKLSKCSLYQGTIYPQIDYTFLIDYVKRGTSAKTPDFNEHKQSATTPLFTGAATTGC
jgi:hypothetical protein